MSTELSAVMRMLHLRPISVPPIYRILTGSYPTAVVLAQVMYWYSAVDREFYKTDAEFANELYMSVKEFRTAKARLESVPFIKITKRGVPQKTFYSVNFDLYVSVMKQITSQMNVEDLPNNPDRVHFKIDQTVHSEIDQMVHSEIPRLVHSNTESTSEITTEIIGDDSENDESSHSKPSSARKSREKKVFVPPALSDVELWAGVWATQHGKDPYKCKAVAKQAFDYYSRMEWVKANDKQVNDWKRTIAGVWFTDDKLAGRVGGGQPFQKEQQARTVFTV